MAVFKAGYGMFSQGATSESWNFVGSYLHGNRADEYLFTPAERRCQQRDENNESDEDEGDNTPATFPEKIKAYIETSLEDDDFALL
jgi:hypothetical protein